MDKNNFLLTWVRINRMLFSLKFIFNDTLDFKGLLSYLFAV